MHAVCVRSNEAVNLLTVAQAAAEAVTAAAAESMILVLLQLVVMMFPVELLLMLLLMCLLHDFIKLSALLTQCRAVAVQAVVGRR